MRPFERFSFLLWGLVVLIVLAQIGYSFHFWGIKAVWELIHLAGHTAGWCGGLLMALSLLFIPRKKKWFTFGKIKFWYRLHVVFGLAGPLLIVLHAYGKYHGFGGLGFLSMWVVLITGIIGHYLYRRLPEEVEHKSTQRLALLERTAEFESTASAFRAHWETITNELEQTGGLGHLSSAHGDSAKMKLPAPTLSKDPGRIIRLWREVAAGRKRSRELSLRVRGLAESERRAAASRELELLRLLDLERDTGTLMALNELFSIWRKVHVPLSWLMWWLVGLHLFAWAYY